MTKDELKKAEEIFGLIIGKTIESPDSLFNRLMKIVNDIDVDYFEDIKRDCEDLPDDLHPNLEKKVLHDIEAKSSKIFDNEAMQSILESAEIEWNELSIEQIAEISYKLRHYQICNSFQRPEYGLEELQELYDNAKKRTIAERIMSSNKADVIKYHHALQDHAWCEACNIAVSSANKFLDRMAETIGSSK